MRKRTEVEWVQNKVETLVIKAWLKERRRYRVGETENTDEKGGEKGRD